MTSEIEVKIVTVMRPATLDVMNSARSTLLDKFFYFTPEVKRNHGVTKCF